MGRTHDRPSEMLGAKSSNGRLVSRQPIDPLSDVLRTVRLKGALFFLVDATDPWCVDVPRAEAFADIILPAARHIVSYHVVVEGRGSASIPGHAPVDLKAGDIIVFPHADAYRIYSAPDAAPELDHDETLQFFRDLANGRLPFVIPEGGGREPRAKFICGFLGCDLAPSNPLFAALPPLLHIRRRPEQTDLLDRLVELTVAEAQADRMGGQSIRLGLSELMFVELLRRHMESAALEGPSWLAGLRDPTTANALALLHADPSRPWTLNLLARQVGVSRSLLAERFARIVGQPAMRYLSLWRLHLARGLLAEPGARVAGVAYAVGFRSEAAFSRAFKREFGLSPSAWSRGQGRDRG